MRISDWSSNVCSSDLQHPLYFATLSRFEAHQPETVAPGSSERAVMDAGAAVHEVTIAALRVGMRDGSIRRTRQPMLLAMTLWSFTHGAIQVAPTKGAFLDEAGLSSGQLLQRARKSVVMGKGESVRVGLGGSRIIKLKTTTEPPPTSHN